MKLSQNNRKHQKTTMLPGAEACNHAAGTASLVPCDSHWQTLGDWHRSEARPMFTGTYVDKPWFVQIKHLLLRMARCF